MKNRDHDQVLVLELHDQVLVLELVEQALGREVLRTHFQPEHACSGGRPISERQVSADAAGFGPRT